MTLVVIGLLVVLPGCVTRTFTVTSEPAGAEVWLDGRRVGETPFTETFLSYGVRRVELRLPGHYRVLEDVEVVRPWWQVFPIAVIADLLWPFELHDEHFYAATLTPRSAGSTSWDDAQRAYADYRRVKRMMDARELLFSGRDPGPAPAVEAAATPPAGPGEGSAEDAGDASGR